MDGTYVAGLTPVISDVSGPVMSFVRKEFRAFFSGHFFCYLLYLCQRLEVGPVVSSHRDRHRFPRVRRVKEVPIEGENHFRRLTLHPFRGLVLPDRSVNVARGRGTT